MSSRPSSSARIAAGLSLPQTSSMVWPIAAMLLVACLHISNMLGRAINWDEFYHFSQIHELLAGTLTKPMQSLHQRLFSWVAYLPGDNISQIIAARAAMMVFVLIAAGATYALASAFASRRVALVCALAWLSSGFVLQHATSYRPDALAAALLMSSLAIMTLSRLDLRASLVVAALAAIATLVTIKSALYAPAFAGIAWLRWQEAGRTREASIRLLLLAVLTALLYGVFHTIHSALLAEAQGTAGVLASSANQMFQPFTFPYGHHAIKAALTAPLLALAVLASPLLIWRAKDLTGPEKVALGALLLPVTTIAFYHNSAAYYYVFMLPPVAVGCLIAFRTMIARYSLAATSAVLALSALAVFATEEREVLDKQRQIVAAADSIFAEPVAYLDFPGMIGHFPKANGFLTPWGAQAYREGYGHTMSEALEAGTVPLLLENDPAFTEVLRNGKNPALLLPEDAAMLRDTFVHFWGPYWLAGIELPQDQARIAHVRVPGPYTVRDASIVFDGMLYLPGEVIHLDRGEYEFTAFDKPARLIWGDQIAEPEMPPPDEPHWTQF